ncbi:MAG: DMT family transporter [Pseudomonadales bacterium]
MSVEVPQARVIVALAFGLATFALAPIMVRLGGSGADAVAMTLVRTVVAATVIAPFWWFKPKHQASPPTETTRAERWPAFLAGAFLAAHFTLWSSSLSYTSVASASVLVTCHPVLLIVIESVFLRARFGATTWVGVLIAFSGAILLALADAGTADSQPAPLLGNGLAFAAAVMFVGYILIGRRARTEHGWLDWVTQVYSSTAICTLVIFLASGRGLETLSAGVVGAGVALALGPQLVGHGSINYAVRFVAPTLLSTLILAEPVFATLLAMALLSETPTLLGGFAMSLTLIGIVMTWWTRRTE